MVSRILTTVAARFLQWMQVMLVIVIEQLVMGCVALGENITPDTRIPYFNYYLATEFVVGCHNPTSIDAWRRKPENEDLDLEQIHPDTLDWAAYNATLGKHLSGAYYKYSLANVRVRASWIQLLDALVNAEPAKLVHGMVGLGYQLRKDVNEDRDAEGVIDDNTADIRRVDKGKGKEKEKDKDKEQERRERRERRREKAEDKERRRLKADAQPKERKLTVGDMETQKQERREKKKERKKAEERRRMEAEAEADAQAAANAAAGSKEESEQGMDVADVDAVSEDLVDRECDVTMQGVSCALTICSSHH
ncbi:hypothetical protein PAXRUDRAFT_20322 [Paxillus rubicundulus Ve08.2h10]|uniref:Uncharacterized protein n=1 Tax=Paxillus rubicundulus Ve08.2h10 TaxID=930991 RepID=A0A0D0CST0_9AGAM|nr:hypothetical protein PAXRUDRAFT_20322 [Paxillus rubicundulus Ve08.2h10]